MLQNGWCFSFIMDCRLEMLLLWASLIKNLLITWLLLKLYSKRQGLLIWVLHWRGDLAGCIRFCIQEIGWLVVNWIQIWWVIVFDGIAIYWGWWTVRKDCFSNFYSDSSLLPHIFAGVYRSWLLVLLWFSGILLTIIFYTNFACSWSFYLLALFLKK